jgi:hypothetical protein
VIVKEFYCIIAPQRSGTTVLQRAMEASGAIKTFYEIFHADIGNNRSNYFFFLRTSEERTRRHCDPSGTNMRAQLEDFLDYLGDLTPLDKILIDVKQNSLHHLDGFWQERMSRPFFLAYAESLGVKFIRLKRENLFLQVVSTAVALNRGRYHFERGNQPTNATPMRIDPQEMLRQMHIIRENSDLVDRWLRNTREVLWLNYESLFEGDYLATRAAQDVAAFCGLDDRLAEVKLPLEKAVSDPRRVIENKSEILEFFKGRRFQEMVQEVLE